MRGPRCLPVSVIATAMQVLNNFVLGRYQPAWDRRNKMSFKRADVSAFYQVCLIIFVLSAMSGSWLIGCKCSSSAFCQECSALVIWKINAIFLGEYLL